MIDVIRSVAGDITFTQRPAAHADNRQAIMPTAPCVLTAVNATDIQCGRQSLKQHVKRRRTAIKIEHPIGAASTHAVYCRSDGHHGSTLAEPCCTRPIGVQGAVIKSLYCTELGFKKFTSSSSSSQCGFLNMMSFNEGQRAAAPLARSARTSAMSERRMLCG